jgi:hypothetical protein
MACTPAPIVSQEWRISSARCSKVARRLSERTAAWKERLTLSCCSTSPANERGPIPSASDKASVKRLRSGKFCGVITRNKRRLPE